VSGMQQILLNSCARATTAAEARYRIDAPISPSRATRVIALDPGAEPMLRRVAAEQWSGAKFFTCTSAPPTEVRDGTDGRGRTVADVVLRSATDGSETRLSEELTDADVAVMVATGNDGAVAATAIGDACTLRGIMTAGVVLAQGHDVDAAVAALRPHARVLLVTLDDRDVSEVLTALRA
jgi:hypothetical protein